MILARPLVLLLLFGTLFFVDLGGSGLFDYDEGCYAETARQMMLSGDWLNPVLNGEPFYEKPPLLYWSQALGYRLFGVGPFGARFFTATAAVALVLALYAFARRPLGPRAAFLAALALGTSLEFPPLARIAFTDMLLMLWLVLCLGTLHRAFEAWDAPRGFAWLLAACFFSGLAMLTKGAIGLLLPGAAAFLHLALGGRLVAVLRRILWILPGLVLLLGVGLSWYLLLGFTHPDGFGFMRELFLEHHVGRFSQPMQGHEGPIFFYVPVLLVAFFPWSPFLPMAFTRGGFWRAGVEERVRFLRLFALFGAVTFLFFSIAATKLPNYVAPVLPCLALLVGNLFDREGRRLANDGAALPDLGWRLSVVVTAGVLFAVAAAIAAAPIVIATIPDLLGDAAEKVPGFAEPFSFGPGPWLAAAVLAATGVLAIVWERRRHLARVAGVLAGGTAAFFFVVILFLLPRYDAHFRAPLREIAALAGKEAAPGRRVALVGIRHAPSVIFYGGRETVYIGKNRTSDIAALFEGAAPEVGITTEAYLENLRRAGPAEILEQRGGYVLFRCPPKRDAGSPR